MAPLFIAASFLYGLAFTVLVLAVTSSQTREDLVNEEMVGKFRGLFYIFAFSVLYFTILLHLSKLYASAHQGIEAFILLDGGVYTLTFWVGQIAIGTLAPIALLYFGGEGAAGRRSLTIASVLFIVGGLAQMFVVIVGGEAYPLDLFPGVAVSSSFYDGVVTVYHPSLPEDSARPERHFHLDAGRRAGAAAAAVPAARASSVRAPRAHAPAVHIRDPQVFGQDDDLARPGGGARGARPRRSGLQEGARLHRSDVAGARQRPRRATISISTRRARPKFSRPSVAPREAPTSP